MRDDRIVCGICGSVAPKVERDVWVKKHRHRVRMLIGRLFGWPDKHA